MAFMTAQTASHMEVDLSASLYEADSLPSQTSFVDLISADSDMDLDPQEKEELLYSDELTFDIEDLGFDNPFADFEDTDPPPQGVQSLQEEFALAAGHLGQYQPLDFRVDEAVAGFGGFANPAGGLAHQAALVEEDYVRLRRAEGGRYGFDIVIRGGRAYPVLQNAAAAQAPRGDHGWHDLGHPVWHGGQEQQQQQGGQEQRRRHGVFRGGIGGDEFEGLLGIGEAALVGEDPVEGVGVCEHAPQAQENGVLNPANNGGELYIDPRDQADWRDDHPQRINFDFAAAAAAAAAAANDIAPAGARPPPPPRPDLPPPHAIAAAAVDVLASRHVSLEETWSHFSTSTRRLQSFLASVMSSSRRHLASTPQIAALQELFADGIAARAAQEAYSGRELGADWFAAAAQPFGGAQEALMRQVGGVVLDRPVIGDGVALGGAQEPVTRRIGGVALDRPMVGDAAAFGGAQEPLMRQFGGVPLDRPMVGDAAAFGGAQEPLMRRFGGVPLDHPMIGDAAEVLRVERELGAARGLVADMAAAYGPAVPVRGELVFIGGRGQDGRGCQLANIARNTALSSGLETSASKRAKYALKMKNKTMKRNPTAVLTACKLTLPSVFATLPTVAVC
ncbi:hypothetical protein KFL_000050420 [Klebsormidium nitens]|uniref:Uncharacterized protein n=1 Tax=Klebsormidium nitens TaxID=105231 RepID=A0A1Y1HHG1_KLENI|nr:hypothetical protein KFL_000050420 [Klebsormidium nitens]|eukprot:GAQ77905.1 hypothetical protein KFL_000050420 [Klebsormidium nitens]